MTNKMRPSVALQNHREAIREIALCYQTGLQYRKFSSLREESDKESFVCCYSWFHSITTPYDYSGD